jgi:hypothetical protein
MGFVGGDGRVGDVKLALTPRWAQTAREVLAIQLTPNQHVKPQDLTARARGPDNCLYP